MSSESLSRSFPPSAFLLRTMASVVPGTRVVDVACGDGAHAEALARLGFDVWASASDPADVEAARARLADVVGEDEAARRVTLARPDTLGYPDAFAPWVVASRLDTGDLVGAFVEAQRVLIPGGWLWSDADGAGPDAKARPVEERLDADRRAAEILALAADAAGLAVATRPTADADRGTVVVVFRRVEEGTVR